MSDIFFEDIEPGAVTTFGSHRVDRDEMVAFAREFDPQPFHLDDEAAQASPVGRLIASGWYTCAVQMRMLCDAWLGRASTLAGIGVDDHRWLNPVADGDVLSVRQTILDKRPSASRPGTGVARFATETLNGDGIVVMRQVHAVLFGLRAGPAPEPAPPRPRPGGAPPSIFPADDPAQAPRAFEDLEIGRGYDLGTYEFTRERIVAFASRFDPQSFHVDEATAATGPFGGLVASGWHTGAAWMSRFGARLDRVTAAGGLPRIGVSPGWSRLRWLLPVRAGDTIRYTSESLDKRPLASRPGWGVLTSRNCGWNGHGEKVLEFTSSAFWAMRGSDAVRTDITAPAG